MTRRFLLFVRGLTTNWVGAVGVVMATTGFLLFLGFELLRVLGIVRNAYVGLVSYMALPPLFITGLILIPIGWGIYRRQAQRSTKELLSERFERGEWLTSKAHGSRLMRWIVALTLINLLVLGIGGTRMLQFMDEPRFCGTACHSVMGPEWAAYKDSPHANVKCVACHVGEGAGALVDSKISGMRQLISLTLDRYERPIPTPVSNLRPTHETCEKCHWPDKDHGNAVRSWVSYRQDEASTPSYTTLELKLGSGRAEAARGIHWHAADGVKVRYASVQGQRERIAWVEVTRPDGSQRRFSDASAPAESLESRTMDCTDCHNRVAHVFEDPEAVVDGLISSGVIDRALPYAKRAALSALRSDDRIDASFRGYYAHTLQRRDLALEARVDRAIAALDKAYRRNIHPGMNVGWGVYPNQRGHRRSGGCFRCHNPAMVDADGKAIEAECTHCHSFLAFDSANKYQFTGEPDSEAIEASMHEYLQRERATPPPTAPPPTAQP